MLDSIIPMRVTASRRKRQTTVQMHATVSSAAASLPSWLTGPRQPVAPIEASSRINAPYQKLLTALAVPAAVASVGQRLATRHSQRALRALSTRPRYIPAHEQANAPSGRLTQWLTEDQRQLLYQFRQVVGDIQTGTATSDREIQSWFLAQAAAVQQLYGRTPLLIKTLAFQILPLKAIPKMEDLSKPGALMALTRQVFYRCRVRMPWLLSNASLLTLATLIVMLLVSHSYLRGKSHRLALEADYARQLEERRKFLAMYPEGQIVDDPFWRETSVPTGQFRGLKL